MKKSISFVLILIITLSLFTGCAKKQASNAPVDENAPITVWASLNAVHSTTMSNLAELPMYKEIEKQTGISVQFIHPPIGQENEQYNLMIASREFPDIIEKNWDSVAGGPSKAIADKIIIPLNDVIDSSAPSYKKILDENKDVAKAFQTDGGDIYCFGGINLKPDLVAGGYFVRTEWLEELGISAPASLEEWENMLRLFKEKKGIESPFTSDSYRMSTYMLFSEAFGIGNSFYTDDSGVIKYGPAQPKFKDYLKMMNRWYAKGYLDNGVFSNDAKVSESKILNDQSGAFYGFIGGTIGKLMEAKKGTEFNLTALNIPSVKKGEPSTPFIFLAKPQKNEDGSVKTAALTTTCAAITTSSKRPEIAAKWLDFLYTDAGRMIRNFGIEGQTYTMQNGVPTYTDLILNNSDNLPVANAMGKYFRGTYPGPGFNSDPDCLRQYYKYPQQTEAMNIFAKDVNRMVAYGLPPISTSADEVKEVTGILNSLKTYQAEMLTKFIMGTEPIENFDSYIKRLEDMKLGRIIEIYQNALARYNNR